MNKSLRTILLALFLLASFLIICTILVNVSAQKDDSPKNFRFGGRGLPGFFKEWSWNFTRIGPYCSRFKWGFGFINISEEFKEDVIKIVENDQDVQKLLSEGYNITHIRPIISANVGKDGGITVKAKRAILVLRKNYSGIAFVWVDIEKGKVTRIEIITRTVIEKQVLRTAF